MVGISVGEVFLCLNPENMVATTCTEFNKVLKEVWSGPAFRRAFELEVKDQVRDMQRVIGQQTLGTLPQNRYAVFPVQVSANLSTNPAFHRARVAEMQRNLARLQRKGKPSYRQRQKNGRAARAGRGL